MLSNEPELVCSETGSLLLPTLVMVENRHKGIYGHMVSHKGVDEGLVQQMMEDLDSMGYRRGP